MAVQRARYVGFRPLHNIHILLTRAVLLRFGRKKGTAVPRETADPLGLRASGENLNQFQLICLKPRCHLGVNDIARIGRHELLAGYFSVKCTKTYRKYDDSAEYDSAAYASSTSRKQKNRQKTKQTLFYNTKPRGQAALVRRYVDCHISDISSRTDDAAHLSICRLFFLKQEQNRLYLRRDNIQITTHAQSVIPFSRKLLDRKQFGR